MSLSRRTFTRIVVASRPCSSLKSHSQQNIYAQLEQSRINIEEPQFIREEKQDDAIFKIYLKRLRPKGSTSSGSTSNLHLPSDDKSHQNESLNNAHSALLYSAIKVYQLKAGTIEKIVECLTNKHGELDTNHMHILFATYRIHTSTKTLIDTILSRYRAVYPASLDMTEDVRQKTLKSLSTTLICLLTSYKEDFFEPPSHPLLTYLNRNSNDTDVQNQCQILLERFVNEENNSNIYKFTSDINNNSNDATRFNVDDLYDQREFYLNISRDFLDIPYRIVAEQLTIVDAELLKCVRPHECLTMKRNTNKRQGISDNRTLSTVDKTIEQFNAVVNCVIATILKEPGEQQRARIVERWIDIAHECRLLKNFSSLTAILNGLLSECIYRLSRTQSHVDSSHRSIFETLKNVFSSCANRKQIRDILDKQLDEIRLMLPEDSEATAKYVDTAPDASRTLDRKHSSRRIRNQRQTMIGTVPYLGLYLSDLTYIDSAHQTEINYDENDKSSKKLINFEKNRKQFEILAQIKLFQSAANAYTTLKRSPYFEQWFHSVKVYNDADSWAISRQLEPDTIDSVDRQARVPEDPSATYRTGPLKAFPSDISLESLTVPNNPPKQTKAKASGSLRSSPSLSSFDKVSLTSNNSFPQRQQSVNNLNKKNLHSNHSRSSSVSSFLTKDSSSQGYMSAQASPSNSIVNCTLNSAESDSLIAKVRLDGRDSLLYKKVRIGSNERTSSLLRSMLDKFGLDPSTYEDYCIEQILPTRSFVLLDQSTVYYALVRESNDEQVTLLIRKKTRQEREQTKMRTNLSTNFNNRAPSGLNISTANSR